MAGRRTALLARPIARVAFMAASVYAVFLALEPHPPRVLAWDKAEHFLGGALIALLALPALPGLGVGWLVGGLAASAALIEVLQTTMPYGRQGDPADWFAGVLGAVLVIVLFRAVSRLRAGATAPRG